jgi:dimethylglycine dehydrogenase
VVGRLTSGAYMFHVKHSGGLGYIRSDLADASRKLEIEILGERRPARILEQAPYDPDGKRLRM